MHFTLVRITTPHMPDTRVFDDVLLPMKFALERLGYKAEAKVNHFNPKSVNICLGANYDSGQKWVKLPPGTIIFNLEQLQATGYPWLRDGSYLKLLTEFDVWDFSRRNIDFLAAQGVKASFLPWGYVPEMRRLAPCPAPWVDALFYGAITPRRRQVLDQLDSKGLDVVRLDKAFGNERDLALYQAKALINIHHSLPASLEIVRLAYALANSRAVVSELNPDTYHYPELAEACAWGLQAELADLAAELARDGQAREKLARRGFEAFSALRLDDALGSLVGRKSALGLRADLRKTETRPDCLNIGSGERFLSEAINIDFNAGWNADLTMTFPSDWSGEKTYQTDRFGEVSLSPASFGRVLLGGLFTLADRPEELLSVCHGLLAEKGRLILTLPYRVKNNGDLPEDRPGFDENSFRPYLDAESFELEKIEYLWSERGRLLEAGGLSVDKTLRVGGAVEAIRIILIKKGAFIRQPGSLIAVSAQKTAATLLARRSISNQLWRRIYIFPAPPWRVAGAPDEAGYTPRPPFPPRLTMRLDLIKLYLKRLRYRLNLKFGLSGRHDRYREKLAEVERRIAEARRLMLM